MSWLEKFFGSPQPKSASLAKERLTLVIAHQRADEDSTPDFLPALQRELVAVISKYVKVNPDDIRVQLEKRDNYEVLEVNIVMPEPSAR
ncbi:MAG: cell division topological specificity factor MinE [Rhodocyclales bacterium]|jgi:cell division topological specificity factor|nr:cell division topological specificity factor MinE [Rhodocyclales bacterium]MDB5888071.1 cell division topological specificity factor MinE [Rhodocyclales bacterium]